MDTEYSSNIERVFAIADLPLGVGLGGRRAGGNTCLARGLLNQNGGKQNGGCKPYFNLQNNKTKNI